MMKCRDFETLLPDWIAGRLSENAAGQMLAHYAACKTCSTAAEDERDLRNRWRSLPDLRDTPDLWPRLAARLSAQHELPARRSPFAMRLRLYTLGGALAAAALCAVVLWPRPPAVTVRSGDPGQTDVDEQHVVQLVSDMRRMPDPESDTSLVAPPHYRPVERSILLGDPGIR
jgi:ferric-dicitrate binding protein FerR (iron transport regulator)